MRIALIGPRGSGKSRISIALFDHFRIPLVSLDTLIMYESGQSITDLVKEKGWLYFRDLEFQCLEKAAQLDSLILDCGGGVVVDVKPNGEEFFSERKHLLLQEFNVFFLDAPLKEVKQKIIGDKDRPSLTEELTADDIYYRRLPWYKKAMNHAIPTSKRTRAKTVKKIIKIMSQSFLID